MAVWSGSVRSANGRATDRSNGRRGTASARFLPRQILGALLLAITSYALFWVVWIYSNGLRDPRYFDGWLLAGGMGLQLFFHIAIKTARLSPKSVMRWRSIHIFVGYLLIAAFISHSDFSWPDTGFEWALWVCFVLVTLSGVFGTYLAWSLQAKRGLAEYVVAERIPGRRAELAQEVYAVVTQSNPVADVMALPAPPDAGWIADLYTNHLRDYFQGQRNITAHLIGSRRPLQRLTDEIDSLSRFADKHSQEKLDRIRNLVVEKDQIDFARVHLVLTKIWLFVHVPVTYALIVLTVLHVIVVYAFSSGDW